MIHLRIYGDARRRNLSAWARVPRGQLHCSFCKKSQNKVETLISTPGDLPRAYICNECVYVCTTVLGSDRPEPDRESALLFHPLEPALMAAIERWIREESQGKAAAKAQSQVRAIAAEMIK